MKVIDLLNKIANKELKDETKIIYDGDYFKYWKKNNTFDRYTNSFFETVEYYNDDLFTMNNLNDEVEIINDEEDNFTGWKVYKYGKEVCSIKVNEIIDKLNEMEK